MKTCLFVVDVQNGFISNETIYVVNRIKELLEQNTFDLVIFSRFINTENSPYRNIINWNKLSSAHEQELVNEIQPFTKNQKVVLKNVYSCINAETLEFLREHHIQKAFVLGIDTDCCVLKTATDLFEHNFHPFVLEYYSASNGGKESHHAALKVLERMIGKNNVVRGPVDRSIIHSLTHGNSRR